MAVLLTVFCSSNLHLCQATILLLCMQRMANSELHGPRTKFDHHNRMRLSSSHLVSHLRSTSCRQWAPPRGGSGGGAAGEAMRTPMHRARLGGAGVSRVVLGSDYGSFSHPGDAPSLFLPCALFSLRCTLSLAFT